MKLKLVSVGMILIALGGFSIIGNFFIATEMLETSDFPTVSISYAIRTIDALEGWALVGVICGVIGGLCIGWGVKEQPPRN